MVPGTSVSPASRFDAFSVIRRVTCAFGIVCFCLPQDGRATSIKETALEDDISAAQIIAKVEVVKIEPETLIDEETDSFGGIQTHVTFRVFKTFKGDPLNTIKLTFAGGKIRRFYQKIEGVPEFKIGDRSIILVDMRCNGGCPIVGLWNGNFKLSGNSAENESMENFLYRAATLLQDASVIERNSNRKVDAVRFESILSRVIAAAQRVQEEKEIRKYLTPWQIGILKENGSLGR